MYMFINRSVRLCVFPTPSLFYIYTFFIYIYRSDSFLLLFSVSIFLSRRYDLTILPGPKSHPITQLIQDLKTSDN